LRTVFLHCREIRLRSRQVASLQVLPQLLEILPELLHAILHPLRIELKQITAENPR
jgi:hypothetical protein